MNLLRIILLPISFLYGVILSIRNLMYDHGFLKSSSFHIPVISIGNLTVGGTGKTPMTEHLVSLLKKDYKIATLSRGYGRKTKGFLIAGPDSHYQDLGDEVLQIAGKHRDIIVAVDEERVRGIKAIYASHPETNLILLDDAFQHRAVNPFIHILLIDYKDVFTFNTPIPSGTLREWKSGMRRADAIVITKLPSILSPMEQRRIEQAVPLLAHQKLFFAGIRYGEFEPMQTSTKALLFNKEYFFNRKYSILLVTGIAKASPLVNYLRENTDEVIHLKYGDHHDFSEKDLKDIRKKFDTIVNKNKLILCTEKDSLRLKQKISESEHASLPFFFMPIEIFFHEHKTAVFDTYIKEKLRTFENH